MSTESDVAADWTQVQLCPGCCTIDDIPPYEPSPDVVTPLVECMRCDFRFPILPGEYKRLTFDAMHRHDCYLEQEGNWQALGSAIVEAIHEGAISGAELAERLNALWPGDAPGARAQEEK